MSAVYNSGKEESKRIVEKSTSRYDGEDARVKQPLWMTRVWPNFRTPKVLLTHGPEIIIENI
jgi:hypothetical protein